jgi:hypothetical protein
MGNGIEYHSVFRTLNRFYMLGLVINTHVLMDNADASSLAMASARTASGDISWLPI